MLLMNIIYVFFLFICEHNINSSKLETVKHCCVLGKNYAESGLVCDTFQPPIAGITKDEEKFCLTSVKSCCKRQYREKQCQLGIEDARNNPNCNSEGSEERKGCCDSCKVGLESSVEGLTCDVDVDLEPLINNAFKSCCEKKSYTESTSTSSTTPVSTSSTTPIITTQSSTTVSNFDENSPGLPRLEGVCDIPEICAHLCIKEKDSYRCDCHKGYTLMADGVSCKLTAEVTLKNRCALHNPCEHECLDTGVAIKCLCDDGYELAGDRRSCDDINECTLGIHDCRSDERCINTEGEYECVNSNSTYPPEKTDFLDKCPPGYMFNSEKLVCDDIDECELQLVCTDSALCINTIGSYKCEESNFPSCPPGFQFRDSIQDCADIDECITGENNCDPNTQFCLNSKGNYTCIDKSSTRACPAGFKKNLVTQLCEDINECAEIPNVCEENEECINEPGGHDCKPKSKSTTLKEDSSSTVTVTSSTVKPTNGRPFQSTNYFTPKPSTPLETSTKYTTQYQPRPSSSTPRRYQCPEGYQYSLEKGNCFDINECLQDSLACDSNQDCYNTPGSFVCSCKNGFEEDPYTGACVDVNECQTGQNDCGEGQRCDNSIGSYFCARVAGCGTGYTLNTATGLCEDDDECTLKTDNCRNLGPRYACRNIPGSYRCIQNPRVYTIVTPNTTSTTFSPPTTSSMRTTFSSNVSPSFPIKFYGDPALSKPSIINTFTVPINRNPTRNEEFPTRPLKKCLPGYKMNAQGQCVDIDECGSSPCKKNEKCINLQNAFQCIPNIHCRSGYELNEDGTECIDVNECVRNLHKCKKSQICKNGPGYYLCHCPGGHKLNNQNECEDIDECEFYRGRICSANANCQNTVGSYKCICKEGFKEVENGCEDVNECNETPNLCHHTCINLWGSYRCACERGFTLNSDNRTCSDIDECEKFSDRKLCVGTCQNVPGSYTCKCPEGYRLGADGWTCQDIDECQQNPCQNPDDICFNVRGGFRCQTIQCPSRYIKDPEHKSHCRRASNVCDVNDYSCLQMPSQYSYHFVTFVSNLPISSNGAIDFFQIKGPAWMSSTADFNMNLKNIRCPRHVKKADESYFKMTKSYNRAIIGIVKPIEGPQEMELQIQMQIFVHGDFQAKLISTIYIIVTEYPF